MKRLIGTLFVVLAVFPQFIESSSPERWRSNELAGPSEEEHSQASVKPYGKLLVHRLFTRPIPNSGLSLDTRYPHLGFIEGLYRKVNDHLYVPLDHDFQAVRHDGIFFGAIFDNYIHPLYNEDADMIIVEEATHKKQVIDKTIAGMLGLNKPYKPSSSPLRFFTSNSGNSENNSRNSENNSRNSENNSRNSEDNSGNSEDNSGNFENNSRNSENNSRNSRKSRRRKN